MTLVSEEELGMHCPFIFQLTRLHNKKAISVPPRQLAHRRVNRSAKKNRAFALLQSNLRAATVPSRYATQS